MTEIEGIAEALADAIRRRMRDARAAAERWEGFAFEPGQEAPGLIDDAGHETDSVRDLALKAFARATDPLNYLMLRHLKGGDSSISALSTLIGLTKLATLERINDLLQVGLVGKTHKGDAVGLTPAGEGIVELVEQIVKSSTEER